MLFCYFYDICVLGMKWFNYKGIVCILKDTLNEYQNTVLLIQGLIFAQITFLHHLFYTTREKMLI